MNEFMEVVKALHQVMYGMFIFLAKHIMFMIMIFWMVLDNTSNTINYVILTLSCVGVGLGVSVLITLAILKKYNKKGNDINEEDIN